MLATCRSPSRSCSPSRGSPGCSSWPRARRCAASPAPRHVSARPRARRRARRPRSPTSPAALSPASSPPPAAPSPGTWPGISSTSRRSSQTPGWSSQTECLPRSVFFFCRPSSGPRPRML